MNQRPQKTVTDYLLVGLNPALVMVLLGSLSFFLLEAFYSGQYDGRLRFIFSMYVMGVVAVARIAIENGKAHASVFALPLAIVAALAMAKFVSYDGRLAGFTTLINWSLLGVVWWSAHKLTWDCTVIDEAEDASGEGLLGAMGFGRVAGDAESMAGVSGTGVKGGVSLRVTPSTVTRLSAIASKSAA
ncbi:MAG: hypothetical protein ACKPEY_00665 [Planctomycetota bacterium]